MSRKQEDDCNRCNASEEGGDGNISSYANPDFDCSSNYAMKRLQEAVFGVASSRITHPPSTEINLHTNALLREIFSVNPTTNHPPYQQMIRKAIEDLNEEGGSSEEIICSYIKTLYEHDVLAWGHESYVSHHLAQLASRGEISKYSNGCYKLPLILGKPKGESSLVSWSRRMQRKRRGRPPKKEKMEEGEGEEKTVIWYAPKRLRGRWMG